MNVRAFITREVRWGLALLAVVALAEGWLRWQLFSDDPAYADLRNPDVYTWRYEADGQWVRSDDHAKLAMRWGLLHPDTTSPHALLGWCGTLDSTSLLPRDLPSGALNAPVVLLGATWVERGITELLHQDSLAQRPLIDLSVAGFATDQDLLLLETVRPRFTRPILLLHIDLDRLDRLQRAFTDRPKPWYTLGVYAGELHGVPVITDPQQYIEAHPPDPGLYIGHLVRTRVLHDTVSSPSAVEARERDLRELAQKLLFVQLHAAKRDGLRVIVLLGHQGDGELTRARITALQAVCTKVGVPCHDLAEEAAALGITDQATAGRCFARWTLHDPQDTLPGGCEALTAIRNTPVEQRTELEARMAIILGDTVWLEAVQRKARATEVPLAVMVRRDARYLMDHAEP